MRSRAASPKPNVILSSRRSAGCAAEETSIVWIEQVLNALKAVQDRLLVLNFGKVIGVGKPEAIMASREVLEIDVGIEV